MLAAGTGSVVVKDGDEALGVLSAADVQVALAEVDTASR
jgi:hypothetical protein